MPRTSSVALAVSLACLPCLVPGCEQGVVDFVLKVSGEGSHVLLAHETKMPTRCDANAPSSLCALVSYQNDTVYLTPFPAADWTFSHVVVEEFVAADGQPHTLARCNCGAEADCLGALQVECHISAPLETGEKTANVTVVFDKVFDMTTTVEGSGTAEIVSQSCSDTACSVVDNHPFTVSARASSGWTFSGWSCSNVEGASAGVCGGAAPALDTPDLSLCAVDPGAACVAHFEAAEQTQALTVRTEGRGSVNVSGTEIGACTASCSTMVEKGAVISIQAAGVAGSQFNHWSGGCSGSTNPISVTIDRDVECTAHFVEQALNVSLTSNISAPIEAGTPVHLTAVVTGGTGEYTFAWSALDSPQTFPTTVAIDVTPDMTTTYIVDVRDSTGASGTAQLRIEVVPHGADFGIQLCYTTGPCRVPGNQAANAFFPIRLIAQTGDPNESRLANDVFPLDRIEWTVVRDGSVEAMSIFSVADNNLRLGDQLLVCGPDAARSCPSVPPMGWSHIFMSGNYRIQAIAYGTNGEVSTMPSASFTIP